MVDEEITQRVHALKIERRGLKGVLTRSLNKCNQEDVLTSEIQVRAAKAEQYFSEYETIQQEIDRLISEEELPAEEQYREEMENKYYAIKSMTMQYVQLESPVVTASPGSLNDEGFRAAIQAVVDSQSTMSTLLSNMAQNQGAQSPTQPSTHVVARHEARLPTIKLPEFDGQAADWIRFRDLFEAVINERTNISNVEKLEYLQTHLKGDALSIVKHLKSTNENYLVAWELLKGKYDKSERVKHVYLKLLVDQQPIKTDTARELQRLYNQTNESYNALKALDVPVQHWDAILLFLLEKKLDSNTASLWFREKPQDEMATFLQWKQFMDRRIFELEEKHEEVQKATHQKIVRNQTRTYATTVLTCPVCNKEHLLYTCPIFKNMNIEQRREIVRKHKRCFNCLQENHRYENCKSSSCRKCGKKHNTLLHGQGSEYQQNQKATSSDVNKIQAAKSNEPKVSINIARRLQQNQVLLPTALVYIADKQGILRPCRALLDSGSQSTLISEACVQNLNLERSYDKTMLFGINAKQVTHSRGKIKISINSESGTENVTTNAICLSTLTQLLPSHTVADEALEYFSHLKLADPKCARPGTIDIIIGADIFMKCCSSNILVHPKGAPAAMETIFGWVIMGEIPIPIKSYNVNSLDEQLQLFSNLEEIPKSCHQLTPEEEAAEEHYKLHTTRQDNGRYVVQLPIKENKLDIGESKTIAVKRFMNVEKRCNQPSTLYREYVKVMQQYVRLGHMQRASKEENECLLPHHAVFKESSTTIKVRIVFDASCHTTNGKSLNDNLMIGAKQQNDLFDILIKFRKYQVGFTGDIEKMYRQIMIHPEDQCLQKILWRENQDDELAEYKLTTVTYGTAAAPFLATRTLQEIAENNKKLYPETCQMIQQNFYMDDLMGCEPNVELAIQRQREMSELLINSGFHLRKWSSNSQAFINVIPTDDCETAIESTIDQSKSVNILGLQWNTSKDMFNYKIELPVMEKSVTKRTVLSEIARLYDPIGWLAPIVVRFKILCRNFG